MYGTVRPDLNDILKHIIIWLLLTTQTFVYVKYGLGRKEVGGSRHLLKTVKHDNIFFAMASKDTEEMTLIYIYWLAGVPGCYSQLDLYLAGTAKI